MTAGLVFASMRREAATFLNLKLAGLNEYHVVQIHGFLYGSRCWQLEL